MNAPEQSGGASRAVALLSAQKVMATLVVAVVALLAFMAVHHNDSLENPNTSAAVVEVVHGAGVAVGDLALTSEEQGAPILLLGCAIFVLCGIIAFGVVLLFRAAARSNPHLPSPVRISPCTALWAPLVQRPSLTLLSISRT